MNKGYLVHTGVCLHLKSDFTFSKTAHLFHSCTNFKISFLILKSIISPLNTPNDFDTEFDKTLINQAKSQFPSILKIPKSTPKSHKTLEKQDNSRTNLKNYIFSNKISI